MMLKMMVVSEGGLRRRSERGGGVVMVVGWWILLLLSLARTAFTYKILTLEGNGGPCNDTVYVDGAVILQLTDQPSYSFSPLNCIITFTAPQFSWSGLTGVVEDVDLRKFEDKADHHMAQNQCVDFIKVVTDTGVPQEEQCGTWKVGVGQPLSPHLGYRRALVGYCSTPPDDRASELKCGVSTLRVQVSVGHKDNPIWRNTRWRQHRGFTFVVTSYRYQYRESECAAGLRSCSGGQGQHPYCIHSSLWCDHHINCGHPRLNLDETSCLHHEMLGGLFTVIGGPWMGVVLVLLLTFGTLLYLYWRYTKFRRPNNHHAAAAAAAANRHPAGQDMNSYAESYEVSSTLSTAPHMAIQVRVVCNPGQVNNGHHHHNYHGWPGSTTTTTTTIDLPPAYDSLFPYGPPPPPPPPPAYPPSPAGGTPSISSPTTAVPTTTTPTTLSTTPASINTATTEGTSSATATITTTSQLSLGVNNHNSASLSTTIVASAEQLNAGASTSTAAEDGKKATTTMNPSAARAISFPCLSTSPSHPYLPTFPDASVSTTTTTTIRGASPSNLRQPPCYHHQCKPEGIPVDAMMVAAKQPHYQQADLPEADMALHEELRTSQPQEEPEPSNDQQLPSQPQSPQNRSPNHQPSPKPPPSTQLP